GEMIELCATHFAAQAPARIAVANRTLERAEKLARRFNAQPIELRSLADHLHEYDIVVSCTASSLPILGKGLVERALRARRSRAGGARRAEREGALKLLARGEEPRQVLDALSQALVNKLLHAPTQALHDTAGEERRALAEMLARLYRLQ